MDVKVVVVICRDACKSSLGGDPHGPRAHVALSGAGASKADKSRKVSDVCGTKRW